MSSSDVEAGLKTGFIAYPSKPFNVPKLIDLIRKTLQKPAAYLGMLEMKHIANPASQLRRDNEPDGVATLALHSSRNRKLKLPKPNSQTGVWKPA